MIDMNKLEAGEKPTDTKKLTPMQEANEALKACEFGWFHIRLMMASFFGVSNAILIGSTSAYILTNAECDLNMDLMHKGVLNAMSFIGMFASTVISGFISDTFGRKLLLVAGFGSYALFTVVTALSQTFLWICISKFFEGITFAAAFNPLYAFTSECCHHGLRDRLMMYQASYMAIGQVWVALFSWVVLTRDWRVEFFDGAFVLNSWNFYLLISAISPIMAAILYSLMPESPKYLVLHHRFEEARLTLTKIYKENTGRPADTYPYKDIWKNREKLQMLNEEASDKSAWVAIKRQLFIGVRNCKSLFAQPLAGYMLLFCALNFLIMSMYNVFRLWFPQLSTIVEYYENDPNHNANLCSMLEAYVKYGYNKNETIDSDVCIPHKSGTETYINSTIIGLVGIPIFLLSGTLINKMGKKTLLVLGGVISTSLALGIRFSTSKYEVVGLISLTVGVGQLMMSLMQVATVERFPTSTRSLSVSLLMLAGRTGTLVGNVIFPILLDHGCNTTFYTLTGTMILVTALLFLLPKEKK